MSNNESNENVKTSILKNYKKIDRNRKRGGAHAQDYMRLIAKLLRSDFTDEERFKSDRLGMGDIARKFDDYARAIDSGVDDATAVKNFTNSLGITTNNCRPEYDKEQAFKEIKIECCNYFKWMKDGVEIKKTCKNKTLQEMTSYEKSLLPKPYTFHKAKNQLEAIKKVAKDHCIGFETLKKAFNGMRKIEQKEKFEIHKRFLEIDIEYDADSPEQEAAMRNYIQNLDFDKWWKVNKFGSDFYVGLPPLDGL